ncbi:GAF domain-containing protein, partial [Deinococcus pimensis]|uniref:GAF domain-containing protein n=1 Tax=Deinococcus pimensis TaxID=309888 RepID=UPI00146FA769
YPGASRAPRTRSAAVLPLSTGARLTGVLAFSYDTTHTFDDEERAFLVTLAGQCALAIERARQEEAARRQQAELEALNATLESRVAERTEELRVRN